MKLTKGEIQFIDNYLKKNEVKFWDVRLELLDHIVLAVEDKIETEGVSFNEALLEVHRSFGNQFIEFGVPKTKVFDKGLYQSNIGFEKFTRNKQKELGKQSRKLYWKSLKQLSISPKFLLEYAFLILLVYICYQFSPKTAFIVSLLAIALPELYKFRYVFREGIRKSLTANMSGLLASSFLCFQGLIIQLYKDEFTVDGITNYLYIICFYLLAYPLTRASLNLYVKTLNSVIKRYNLLIS